MGLITFLRWEVSSLTRPKLILPLAAFMFFSSYLGGEVHGSSTFIGGVGTRDLITLARRLGRMAATSIDGTYLALAFFSAVLASTSIAGELDSGILKFYLSQPMGRLKVFACKFLSVYMLLLSFGAASVYYRMFMEAPEDFPALLAASPFYIIQPLLLEASAILFTLSVSTYFSVVSRRAYHASLYSLFVLYSFYSVRMVSPGMRWFLPPYAFSIGIFELANLTYFLAFSLGLLILAIYIFTRRLEVP